MNKKCRVILSVIQIIVGILGAIVFIRHIFNGGKVEMILMSFMLMILGTVNGIRGIYRKK